MSTRARATKHSVAHSDKNDKLHQTDVKKNKELKAKRRANPQEPRQAVPPEEEPKFASDVSALKSHGCYRVVNGDLVPMEGPEWQAAFWRVCLDLSWYHQLQKRKTKKGITESYKVRVIKDREKLGKTDKHHRPETDVARETIDLRPDHSRAIQYMLEQGLKTEADVILAEARTLKIRLFEKIYRRWAIFLSDHDDSGQHHDDVWHTGIEEDVNDVIRGRDKNKRWVFRAKRTRTPFVSYGVGIGAACWSRHFSALRDAGCPREHAEAFAGSTLAALDADALQVHERHQCKPRDVRLRSVLDRLVHRKLKKIAPAMVEKANREYAEFLEDNYRAGLIGVKKSKRARIKALEAELVEQQRRADELESHRQNLEAELMRIRDMVDQQQRETIEEACQRVVNERDEHREELATVRSCLLEFVEDILREGVREFLKMAPPALLRALAKLAEKLNLKDLKHFAEQLANAEPDKVRESKDNPAMN